MPLFPTYPGVYIQELPSPVHTIRGVPTAITALVGAAARGPVNEPISIQSLGDFERTFGNDKSLPLYQAVRMYFGNGGSHAIIVRIGPKGLKFAECVQPLDRNQQLRFQALSPGASGNQLLIKFDQNGVPPPNRKYPNNPNNSNTYNLTVTDTASGLIERYAGISTDSSSPRSLQRILEDSSLIMAVTEPRAATPPARPSRGGAEQPAGDGPPPPPPPPPPAVGGITSTLPLGQDFPFQGGEVGSQLPTEADLLGDPGDKTGFYAVAKHNTFFNILVLTPLPGNADVETETLVAAAKFAYDHRAMLIADAPSGWTSVNDAVNHRDDQFFSEFGTEERTNTAVYFPRLTITDPDVGTINNVGPSAAVAGLHAATDDSRGVWKAAAGIAVQLGGVKELSVRMSDFENGMLNPIAVNCLRSLPVIGNVVWGARTMAGDDISASQWKYVPIRRLALFIEESLYRGTQWVVFEPNDEPLWAQVRLNVGAFMHTLFLQGAFQGTTANDAYFVKCDSNTNPQADIDNGILNVIVGFAPLKPAEFVIVKIQQIAGQIAV
jgi:uncharacterized protein